MTDPTPPDATPLTPADVAEIRARNDAICVNFNNHPAATRKTIVSDVPRLLASHARLSAALAAAQAEGARLREAMKNLMNASVAVDNTPDSETARRRFDYAYEAARAALAAPQQAAETPAAAEGGEPDKYQGRWNEGTDEPEKYWEISGTNIKYVRWTGESVVVENEKAAVSFDEAKRKIDGGNWFPCDAHGQPLARPAEPTQETLTEWMDRVGVKHTPVTPERAAELMGVSPASPPPQAGTQQPSLVEAADFRAALAAKGCPDWVIALVLPQQAAETPASPPPQAGTRIARDVEAGNVWYWQGDGSDHLESLTCPVVIHAQDLRELLTPQAGPPQPSLVEALEKLANPFDRNLEPNSRIGWSRCHASVLALARQHAGPRERAGLAERIKRCCVYGAFAIRHALDSGDAGPWYRCDEVDEILAAAAPGAGGQATEGSE